MKPLAKYLSFTGQSGCYAELPLSVLAGATTFTIEAKISTTSTKSSSSNWQWGTIAGREIGSNWQDDFGFCVNDGKLCFWAEPKSGGSSSTRNTTSSAIVNDGEIHKVAVVSSNGAIDLYCDSVNVAHTNNVDAKITNAQTILLAYDSDSNSYLQMDLYEIRFWNVARTQAEIFADIDGTESGLQGWYLPSNDGLKDYSGNNRHATLYGSPAYNEVEVDSLLVAFTADVQRVVKNDARLLSTLKVWLPFDESTTADKCGNEWTTNGSPTISETNSVTGKALQLNGSSYLQMNGSLTLGGQDFTIDGWFNLSSSTGNWPRVFALFNTTDSDAASIQLQRREQTTNFQVCCNGAFSETFSVSLNTRHHFELDYVHSTSTVYVFIDGALMKTFTKTMDVTTYATVSLGLPNFTADAKFIGSIDEFQIYDGVALHTEKFTPPTAEDYAALAFILDGRIDFSVDVQRRLSNRFSFTADVQRRIVTNAVPFEFAADVVIRDILPVTFAADVQRKLSNQGTVTADVEVRVVNRSSSAGFWRYENPGSGDYIYYHDNITTEQVGYDKSVTGVAFYGGDNNDMFNTPAGLKEVWMRFDVWLNDNGIYNGVITCGHYSSAQGKIIGLTRATGRPAEIGIPAEGGIALYLPIGTRASLLLYMLSDASNGVIQATCAGNTHTYTGNVNDGADFNSLVVWTDSYNNTIRISNIVVSNAPLTLEDGWHREPVAVEMNIKAPDLCVRKNGTTYTVPFATTQDPPADSVVARLGGQMVYNPLVATDNANASVIKTRYNGNNRALSASFG